MRSRLLAVTLATLLTFSVAARRAVATPPGAAEAKTIRAMLRPAEFFTEVFVPRRVPHGIAITFHRGAWGAGGAGSATTEHADDHAWLRRGWLVVNSSYRPSIAGLRDVRFVYREVRRATHRQLPICLVGASAGGNLALAAASGLPGIACVVAEAAPTDLLDIASQTAYDPSAAGGSSSTGPSWVRDAAVQELGENNLQAFSPLFTADRITAPVLLAEAEQDPLIPYQQESDLCTKLGARCAGLLSLAPGPLGFVHAPVARASLARFRRAESDLARRVATAPGRRRGGSPAMRSVT